jgi:hypothetical protein
MKVLQVTVVALPILAAACAQPPLTAALPLDAATIGVTAPAEPDAHRQPAPSALKYFDSVFDAQYVRKASMTPVTALR